MSMSTTNPEVTMQPTACPHAETCRPTKGAALCAFLKKGACSTTLMNVLDRAYDQPLKLEEDASGHLAGGMMQGYQCGMLWGSTLAAGARAHRLHGPGAAAETAAVAAAQRLVESFRDSHGTIDCLDITEAHPQKKWQVFKHFFLKGGTIRCARMIARFAPQAFDEIEAALSEPCDRTSCRPASCAALLARKMGASEEHATMAAGLAGGIGLSGGACGALGAAVWLTALRAREEGVGNRVVRARIADTIDRFLKVSEYEFECSAIVGRRFADAAEHADHLAEGGCAELIEALARIATTAGEPDAEASSEAGLDERREAA